MPGARVCVLSSGLVSASWILNHRPSIGPWFDGAPLSCAVVVLNYAAGGRDNAAMVTLQTSPPALLQKNILQP